MKAILVCILVPNTIFILSVAILVLWHCPYCQVKYISQFNKAEEN